VLGKLGRNSRERLATWPPALYLYRKLRFGRESRNQFSKFLSAGEFTIGPGAKANKILIFFPVINWASRIQRPQHLARQYRDDGYLVLYLTMDIKKSADASIMFEEIESNIYQLWLQSESDCNLYRDSLSRENIKDLVNIFELLINELIPSKIELFIQYPIWEPIATRLKEVFPKSIYIYDCIDDHSDFENPNPAIIQNEKKLLKSADLVIVTSKLLHKKFAKQAKRIHLLRNACEFEHFNKSNEKSISRNKEKGIVGYFGAISSWFDISLVYTVASHFSSVEFRLIGSTFGSDTSNLKRPPNVRFLGEISYELLPGHLREFDVAIIPFKIQPLTMATNPVKIYEYLTLGKPVVAIALPEIQELESLCYVAKNQDEFIALLAIALEENNELLIERRIEFAKSNQWSSRYSEIEELTNSMRNS